MLGCSTAAVDSLVEQLDIGDDLLGLDDRQKGHQLAELLLETDVRAAIAALRAAIARSRRTMAASPNRTPLPPSS